ncbi:MAG: 6-phosphofructokinase [Armatimonadota bacterium]
MKVIGVLTSGGDAPGMNACVRGVVRTALANNILTIGIRRGFAGLIAGDTELLTSRSVGGIARWGGTILQTARSEEFKTPQGFRKAINSIRDLGIEGLVVAGGDGSLHGALELHKAGIPCVGVPASIDNDICFTDLSIGVDTAMNTILEAMDKVKDTASSHQRAFLIEVMGRRSGYLAMATGVAGGAEMVIAPEFPVKVSDIMAEMTRAHERGKPHFIIIVAEGATPSASELCEALSSTGRPGFEARLTVLGHVQRGGSPSATDRILATRLSDKAVRALIDGESGVMAGLVNGKIKTTSLVDVLEKDRPVDEDLIKLSKTIAL